MNKKYIFLIIAFFAIVSIITFWNNENVQLRTEVRERKDDAQARNAQLHLMLRDPQTGKIPDDARESEREFLARVPKRNARILSKTGSAVNVQALTWTERGPDNVGGRVRGMDLDNQTSGNSTIIIAGGVSGGIWKSINDGTTWVQKTATNQLHSVTCIVQDKRSGKNDTWYAGSGENIGNSADGGGGASYLGDGVFKSINNGESWTLLSSTSGGSPSSLTSDWQYVFNLAVDNTNSSQDEIYAATGGGILRSTNGGTDWTSVRTADIFEAKTDVAVSPTSGYVIAAMSSDGAGAGTIGLTKSLDGVTYTDVTPGGFPSTYDRIVLAIAPGDENYVYAFVQVDDGPPSTHELWVSTDAGANWSKRTGIPGGSDLSTQGGYNMLLAVKPNDVGFVLIGGVVLWRSTDGFATTGNTTRVGGLGTGSGIQWDTNVFGDYIKHHPDNHLARFGPDNQKCYVANDGGVHITADITAAGTVPNPIVWVPKRQTFNVTQLYALSLAPEMNDPYIAAGLQDRGNFTTSTAGLQDWFTNSGGDGATCEVAPVADNAVYLSTSEGALDRYDKSPDMLFTLSTEIKPSLLSNPLFTNPILLDPSNSLYLYYAGADGSSVNSGVWRNDDAKNATTTLNWTYLTSLEVTSDQVSAFGMSTSDNSVLYYGTSGGKVYSVATPNTGSAPTRTTITGGSFPAGYVSCIAVDPVDKDKVMVVFSNYSVSRLWYTINGGTSWTNVDGNLSGGSGPSVRWAVMFPLDGVSHYFIATSVGVYFTILLDGGSTVWTQEATTSIGNVVSVMLDWRVDSGSLPKTNANSTIYSTEAVTGVTLAVGTHGRGVFTAAITDPLPVELVTFSGLYNSGTVELTWETATEVDNYGFEIERKNSAQSEWKMIGFVSGSGNSNSPKYYSFTDNNLIGSEKFYYRLKQIDTDGKFEYSNIVEVTVNIGGYKLVQNYPNPFNPSTKINYTIPETADVKVDIFSITGELVTQLVNLKQNAGNYSVEFNTSDNRSLSSGMYIYRISVKGISGSNFTQTKKMVLVK